MRYVSTRGQAPALGFEAATLAGLASDGGLYVPDAWPTITAEQIEALAGLSYAETAVRILPPLSARRCPRSICARCARRRTAASATTR